MKETVVCKASEEKEGTNAKLFLITQSISSQTEETISRITPWADNITYTASAEVPKEPKCGYDGKHR